MTKNIGTADRILRFIMGLILVGLIIFVVNTLVVKVILGIIAAFCFFQALMSWCALYQLMGKNTCPME